MFFNLYITKFKFSMLTNYQILLNTLKTIERTFFSQNYYLSLNQYEQSKDSTVIKSIKQKSDKNCYFK